jgi:four helix bundle protein
VVEETDETLYWLEILVESGFIDRKAIKDLYKEGLELVKLFSSARKTVGVELKNCKI